jgi:uncharacterized coiled-coil protein SlyX
MTKQEFTINFITTAISNLRFAVADVRQMKEEYSPKTFQKLVSVIEELNQVLVEERGKIQK